MGLINLYESLIEQEMQIALMRQMGASTELPDLAAKLREIRKDIEAFGDERLKSELGYLTHRAEARASADGLSTVDHKAWKEVDRQYKARIAEKKKAFDPVE